MSALPISRTNTRGKSAPDSVASVVPKINAPACCAGFARGVASTSTTARLAGSGGQRLRVHEVDDVLHGVGVRFGQNAVAKVEDVTAATAAPQNVFHARR